MKAREAVTLKELHAKTGELVRQAAQSDSPIQITDRGKPIAVLGKLSAAVSRRRRSRVLLPEYRNILKREGKGSVIEDLDAIRCDR